MIAKKKDITANSVQSEPSGEMAAASQPKDSELSKEVAVARLREAYRVAAEQGSFVFDPPLDASLLISNYGSTQTVFPLSDGGTIGKNCRVGLPRPCIHTQVESAEQVPGSKDLWITLSGVNEHGTRRSSRVLMIYGKTGQEAIRTEQDVQSDALKDLYTQAQSGSVTKKLAIDISLLIGDNGTTQMVFPLLDGRPIGKQCGIGLPKPCSHAQVESAEQVPGAKEDLWLTLSGVNKKGVRRSSRVLMVHGKTGREAIKTEQDVQSDALKELYEQALRGSVARKLPLDISLLIGNQGGTQVAFPLLDGRTIGAVCRIGLPQPCTHAQVESAEQVPSTKDLWLKLSVVNKEGERRASRVLIVYGKAGPEAIKSEQEAQSDALKELYKQALSGSVTKKLPLDISLLIGNEGAMQKSFPLSDGRAIGKKRGIGLPQPCSHAQVELAEQVAGSRDLWITVSAVNKHDERKSSRFLMLYGKTGQESLKTEQDVQSDALKELYEQAKSGAGAKKTPLDISFLISSCGRTQHIFPLPGGGTLGKTLGIGLPTPCSYPQVESAEQVAGSENLWIAVSGVNKHGERKSSRFLILFGKNGPDAIQTEQDAQSDALKELYEQALSGSVTKKHPLDISLLIGNDGKTQMVFPLLDGWTIRKNFCIGLPSPCSDAQVESAERVASSKDVWITLSAMNKDGARRSSRVLMIYGKTGSEAIKTEQDVQSDALKELYKQASSRTDRQKLPLDISFLISRYGRTQVIFPLPGGGTIGNKCGIGLPKDISHCKVTEMLHLAEDRYYLTISGITPGGKAASTRIVVSSTGIIRPVATEPGIEIVRGFALDRYVAHLLSVSNISGVRDPLYLGSALTGERFMPNAVAGDAIVHSKWGNSGLDVLEYVQRYARLRLWNNDLKRALHLVVTTNHLSDLRTSIEALEEHVHVKGTGITDIETWCSEIPVLDRASIHDELRRISVMSSIGDIEWLRGRTYEPTLPSAPRPQEPQGISWQERVAQLAQGPELLEALKLHKEHHSLYWEREYHLDLVKHCSYLIDQILGQSSLPGWQRDEARQLVYEIYPELKRYPDAWRRLEEPGADLVDLSEGGEGSSPYLVPFDLARELARCGVKETVSLAPVNEIDWGHAKDVGPKVHDLFRRYSRIEDALNQLLIELQGYPADTCESVRTACLEWITAAVLDVRVSDRLPPSLTRAKGATDPTSVFLQELNKLSPEAKLYYVSGQRELKIRAQQLKDSLEHIEYLGE